MLGFFQTISRRINFVEGVMLAVILTLINLAIFHDILTRYVGTPAIVPGCEEIARFGLVWFTFLGASFAYKKKAHPAIGILVTKLPKNIRRIVKLIAMSAIVFFLLILIFYGSKFALRGWVQIYPVLEIRLFWTFVSLPLSGLLMIIHTIGNWRTNDYMIVEE